MDYKKILNKARRTNAKRDRTERVNGFTTPDQGPLSLQLRTAMSAIKAGIKIDDWDCVAEGQAMLEKIEAKIRKIENEAKMSNQTETTQYPTIRSQLRLVTGRQDVTCQTCGGKMTVNVGGVKRDGYRKVRPYRGTCRKCKTMYSAVLPLRVG